MAIHDSSPFIIIIQIENLQNLLSEAQLQGNELHDLLMELEQKWKDQEKLNEVDAWEKDDVIHELRLKVTNSNYH